MIKKLTPILFASTLIVGFCHNAVAATEMACSGEVVSGCVGTCGSTFSDTHTTNQIDIDNSDKNNQATFCLYADSSNLCPSTGAYFELSVNGVLKETGDLSEFEDGLVKAKAGDEVAFSVSLGDKDPNIVCVILGETSFRLGYANKVKIVKKPISR